MMYQEFYFTESKETKRLLVLAQQSKSFDAMSIQISKVVDFELLLASTTETATFAARYLYEEIDKSDMVTYSRYMGIDNIKRNYPWIKMK